MLFLKKSQANAWDSIDKIKSLPWQTLAPSAVSKADIQPNARVRILHGVLYFIIGIPEEFPMIK
jgi:hypothetical protein